MIPRRLLIFALLVTMIIATSSHSYCEPLEEV
jgi:hypothetical protein